MNLIRTRPHQNISVKHSLQSHEAAPAGDRNSSPPGRNGEMRPACAQCQAAIVDGQWFCRLPGNEGPLLLCSPSCALRFLDRSPAQKNGWDQDWDSCEHHFTFS